MEKSRAVIRTILRISCVRNHLVDLLAGIAFLFLKLCLVEQINYPINPIAKLLLDIYG